MLEVKKYLSFYELRDEVAYHHDYLPGALVVEVVEFVVETLKDLGDARGDVLEFTEVRDLIRFGLFVETVEEFVRNYGEEGDTVQELAEEYLFHHTIVSDYIIYID